MPYFPRLIELLLAAPQRARDGMIQLTPAEAAMLRACEFPTAAAGWWPIPPIPAHVPVPDWLFRLIPQLVRETPPPGMPPQVAPSPSRQPPWLFATPPAEQSGLLLARQLRSWWHRTSSVQRRTLKSLLNCPDGRIRQRHLRKRLRRLAAREFHATVDSLLAAKIVTAEIVGTARWIVLPAAVREGFALLGLRGGRRPQFQRAMARAGERTRRRRRGQMQPARHRTGQRRRRRMSPVRPTEREVLAARRLSRRRKPIPPVGTPEWGRHMRALKAAYASHAACLRDGIVQTAQATSVRQAKRAQRNRLGAAGAAPATGVAPVTALAQQPTSTRPSYGGIAASISSALRYSEPIGRRQRMAEERRRR